MPDERTSRTCVAALAAHDLLVRPIAFRRGTMACTGIEFCKLAIVETKQPRPGRSTRELEKRLPDFDAADHDQRQRLPQRCARFQIADIGFKGSMVRDANGETVEGFQVHLGGHLGAEAAVRPQVPRPQGDRRPRPPTTVERVLRGYLERREPGESRSPPSAARADEAWLLT